MYYGDIRLGDTIDIKFTTRQISGAPFTLAGSPAVSAYVGNGTTEITAGITLTADFDSRTGLNNVRVVATSGNGFATATNVDLVITAGTVNSVSVVGEVIGSFSIENRSALMPTTAARTLDVTATGEAGLDWANIGSPTTAVNLSATNIDVDQVVASVSGAVGSVTGNVGGNVTGSVGSVTGNVGGNVVGSVGSVTGITASDVGAIKIVTDKLDTTIEVQSASIYRFTAPALVLAPSGTSPTLAEIVDGVWDEPIAGHLAGGSTGAALNGAGSAGDPWTTPLPGAYGAGTAGFIVGTNLDAQVSAVKAKTDNLPTDPADESLVIAATDAIFNRIGAPAGASVSADIAAVNAKTTNLPSDPADESLVIAATDAIFNRIGAPAGLSISADIAGVQSDTNDIQGRLPAALVAGRIDASVGAMAANVLTAAATAADFTTEIQTGLATAAALTTVGDNVTAVKAKTDSLTFTVAGQVDANVQYVNDTAVTGNGQPGTEWGP